MTEYQIVEKKTFNESTSYNRMYYECDNLAKAKRRASLFQTWKHNIIIIRDKTGTVAFKQNGKWTDL